MKHVVIVGGGFGGLSAACHLAAAGARVTLLEARSVVGGKAGRFHADGFSWDTGPTLLTMPDVLNEVLALAGLSLADEVPLIPLEPLCRYRFASGHVLDHHADPERTAQQIARFSTADASRWGSYVSHAKRLHDVLGESYTAHPFVGLTQFAARIARKGPSAMSLGGTLGTLDGAARRWFGSDEMRALVDRFATYVGASPFEASGALAMIAHVEGRGDAVYPRGGIHAVANLFARAATLLGVKIALDTPVARVHRHHGAWRIVTARGDALEADAVVLNVDPLLAAEKLLDPDEPFTRNLRSLRREPRSLSGVAVLLGLEGHTPGLALHNIFFPSDYAREFREVMDARVPPTDPTVYIAAGSHADPSAAPEGHEALFALVNAPARLDLDWDTIKRDMRDRVVAGLARVDPTAPSRLRHVHTLGPTEFAATGSLDGALYGAAPHGAMGAFRRPPQRVEKAHGLYLVGGATHPGGGVPMVTLSGRHAATLCLADLSSPTRATRNARSTEYQ